MSTVKQNIYTHVVGSADSSGKLTCLFDRTKNFQPSVFTHFFFPSCERLTNNKECRFFFPFLSTECFFNFLLITVCMCFCTSVSVQVCASGQHSSLSSQSDLYHPRLSGWGYLARGPPLLKGRSGTQIVTLSLRVFFFSFLHPPSHFLLQFSRSSFINICTHSPHFSPVLLPFTHCIYPLSFVLISFIYYLLLFDFLIHSLPITSCCSLLFHT